MSTATLTIVNINPDLVGPRVTDLAFGGASSITSLVASFSKTLDPTSASNPANYTIFNQNGVALPIRSVSFDPATNLVTIIPVRPLAPGPFYRLQVNGGPGGVTDTALAHNLLDGDANGTAGGNYEATFARSSRITYTDSHGALVSLRLTGGGLMELFRATNGDGQVLRILGGRPFRSVISGSVRGGAGFTTLQAIEGLVPFGQIKSTLTSPPFLVGNQPIDATGGTVTQAETRAAAVDHVLAHASHKIVAQVRRKK